MSRRWWGVLGFLLICAPVLADPLERGLEAFRAGDLERALIYFQAAQAEGLDTPQLHFNLGVTYYRLGRHEEAEDAFHRLVDDPDWAALAYYNLGRVADRRGAPPEAARRYREARARTNDERLYSLAGEALARLEVRDPRRTRGLLLAAVGFDDNVTLGGEADQLGVSRESDLFADLLAAGDLQVAGNPDAGWRLSGSAYLRRHRDVNAFDFAVLRPGLWRDHTAGAWRLTSGGFADITYLEGEHFTTTHAMSSHAARPVGDQGQLHVMARLGYVDGSGPYRPFTGQQHRAGVEWRGVYAGTPVQLGYRLEYNDRRDTEIGDESFSHSPLRHRLRLRGEFPVTGAWWAYPEIVYQYSHYPDADRRFEDGELRQARRRDERWVIRLRGERPLSDDWLLFAEYEHTDENDVTFDKDAYSRNVLMVGVEYVL